MAYSNYSINVPSCPSGSHSSGIVISILTYAFVACRVAKHPKKKTTPLLLHHHPPPPPPPPPPRRRVLLPPTTTTTTTATTTAGTVACRKYQFSPPPQKPYITNGGSSPSRHRNKLRNCAKRPGVSLQEVSRGVAGALGLENPFNCQPQTQGAVQVSSLITALPAFCLILKPSALRPTPLKPLALKPKARHPEPEPLNP